MKMKKAASVCTAALMAAAMLAGCTGGTSSKVASASSSADTASSAVSSASASAAAASSEDVKASSGTANSDGTYLVGVCQLVQHPALDAATKGFEDELKAEFGDKVKFDEQNAAGDASTATQICQNLVSENCDLILANATASLQSAAAATSTIPILGTSITEYGVALDISDFDGTVGGNISGTSDLAPLDQQADMVSELFPDAKNVGIVYCSAEPNSKYQADKVQEYLEKAGLTVTTYTFSDSNDVSSVVGEACSNNDVLYIPTDNTAASCTEAINNVAQPAGVPIVCGEEGIMAGCGVATLSIDYYELGKTTGDMAVKILKGESDISTMPIEYYQNPVKEYNPTLCEALGITVPDGYKAYTPEEDSES